jgi:hypothetical protein
LLGTSACRKLPSQCAWHTSIELTVGPAESQLRLFLSVDLSGSTALKGEANYQTLSAHLRLLQKAASASDPSRIPFNALPSLDEYDWVAIQQNTFSDFHSEFSSRAGVDVVEAYEVYPWKALGDELIYSMRLTSRERASKLLTSFITAVRLIDGSLAKKGRLRLKAAAWIAGFPIRNRVVQIPAPAVSYEHEGKAHRFPYPQDDFWGPDMDIGFRLSKCTFPGMCVASASLVELLASDKSNYQLRFAHVGWERLKGVWHERPYPVFWAELPENREGEATRAVLSPWSAGESPFVKEWEKADSTVEAKAHLKLLTRIRETLPDNFGSIRPYVPEEDGVPADDQQLLELVASLPKGAAADQNSTLETAPVATSAVDISDLLAKFALFTTLIK